MAASPQPVLKLDRYGRNPDSPSERLRRRKGFVPLPYSFLADVSRLSSGSSCMSLIYAVHAHACWDMKMDWSVPLPLEDWAQLSCCDIRTVQRDRDYLKGRGMADVQVDTKRRYSFRLQYQAWQALEDYQSWKAKQKPTGSEDEPEPEDSTPEVRIMAGTVRLLKAPAVVKSGKTSRAWPINCGVKSVQVSNPNSLDLRYDAVVQAGRLLITPLVLEKANEKRKANNRRNTLEEKAKTVASKGSYDDSRRHGCHPGFALSSPSETVGFALSSPGKQKDERRTQGEHPRAEELSSLFDPLLLRSCQKTLSADAVALSEACEAAGTVDHDWLVKFVVERFERPVKSPRYAKLICQEARENWEKVKDLPAVTRKPPGKQHFQDQVRQLATERLRRDGCI